MLLGLFTVWLLAGIDGARCPSKHTQFTLSECRRLSVHGLSTQHEFGLISGHFISIPSSHDTYRHQCRPVYLYRVRLASVGMWVIGPSPGGRRAYFMTYDDASSPLYVISSWRTLIDGEWSDVAGFHLRCADTCTSFHLSSPFMAAYVNGVYTLQDEVLAGRVVYRRSDPRLQLYLYHSERCPAWVLGGGDDLTALTYTTSDASSPTFLPPSTPWLVTSGPNKTRISSLHITCLETTSGGAPPMNAVCGVRRVHNEPSALLFSASTAYHGKWPFTIAYRNPSGSVRCGGVLVARRWVLTAGHCLKGDMRDLHNYVQLGVHNADFPETTARLVRIRRTILHPNFTWKTNPFRLDFDIGLIELEEDVALNDYITPGCLPQFSEAFPFASVTSGRTIHNSSMFTNCHVVGWGQKVYSGEIGGELQEAAIRSILPPGNCAVGVLSNFRDWLLGSQSACMTGANSARICKGDSGSPMFCQQGDRWFVLGVASWSFADCWSWIINGPSFFTSVSNFIPWIKAYVEP